VGIGKVAPLYFLLSVLGNARIMYTRAIGRPVPISVAHTILPAVFLGYAVPLVLARAGIVDDVASTSFSRAALPILVAFHTYAAKRLLDLWNPPDAFDMYKKADVRPLRDAYRVSFLLAAGAHIALFLLPQSALGLDSLWKTAPSFLWEQLLATDSDFPLFALATALFCLHSVYELRRTGWATTGQALGAAAAVVGGLPLVGPTAVYAAVWYWREGVWSQEVDLQGRKD
jgi:hypothetical protein